MIFLLQGGVLNITDVKRTDSGSYTVEAGNNEGKTNFTMALNVQCKYSPFKISCMFFSRYFLRNSWFPLGLE